MLRIASHEKRCAFALVARNEQLNVGALAHNAVGFRETLDHAAFAGERMRDKPGSDATQDYTIPGAQRFTSRCQAHARHRLTDAEQVLHATAERLGKP
jgi:hypothetical protein